MIHGASVFFTIYVHIARVYPVDYADLMCACTGGDLLLCLLLQRFYVVLVALVGLAEYV